LGVPLDEVGVLRIRRSVGFRFRWLISSTRLMFGPHCIAQPASLILSGRRRTETLEHDTLWVVP